MLNKIIPILFVAVIATGAAVMIREIASGGSSSHSQITSLGQSESVQAESVEAQIADADNAEPAPEFSLQDLSSNTVSLADFRGKKAVVLDFWATWCPNCRRDMPQMNALYPKYKDDIEIIAINLQENKSTVQRFVDSQGFDFPILLDPRGTATQSYGVFYTNTHVLIDKEGRMIATIPGDITEEAFRLLAETNPSTPGVD